MVLDSLGKNGDFSSVLSCSLDNREADSSGGTGNHDYFVFEVTNGLEVEVAVGVCQFYDGISYGEGKIYLCRSSRRGGS